MRMSSMPPIPCCRASKSSTRGFAIGAFGCRIPWPTMHPEACLSWAIAPSNLMASLCPPAAWCWRNTAPWHARGQPESVDRWHRVCRHSIHLKVKSQMPLSIARIAELAQHLETAAREHRTVPKLSDMEPRLTLADAYEVQWSLRHRRLGAGSRVSGLKMG